MSGFAKLHGSPWKWLAFAALSIGLLGSIFVPPMSVSASHTVMCDDGGGSGGINGYEPGSQCDQLLRTYQCSHSDAPTGPTDTLTCALPIPTPTPIPPTPVPPTPIPPTPVPPTPTPVPQMWDCGAGIVFSEYDLDDLSEVATQLGMSSFNPANPCTILEAEVSLVSNTPTHIDIEHHPSDGTIPNEHCFVFMVEEFFNTPGIQFGIPMALRGAYEYCTDGQRVYGETGKPNTQPTFVHGRIDGGYHFPDGAGISCAKRYNRPNIDAQGWMSYNGYFTGSFVTQASGECKVTFRIGNQQKIINTFDLYYTTKVFASGFGSTDPANSFVEITEVSIDEPFPPVPDPQTWNCSNGVTLTENNVDQAVVRLEAADVHTAAQIDGYRAAPCKLLVVTIKAIEAGSSSGDTKGDLECPPDGNQAPSVRWTARDWYGIEYAYYQLSQYACWNGESVTAADGTSAPPPPIITAEVTPMGELAGIVYKEAGDTQTQYEQWNGNAKGIYRVQQTNILFTGTLPWGLPDIPGLPDWEFRPSLSITIRADGSVERQCSGGASIGGSCPRD